VKQAYIAQGVPQHAVGTLDELQKVGMPARVFHSCNEPTVDGTIRGCPLWHICTMDYKGKSAAEGGGPRNHCWERIKSPAQGGAIVRNVQPCFWGVAQQDVVAENKSSLLPIADEGDEYVTVTSVPKPKPSDPFYREVDEVRFEVKPYKRLGEDKKTRQVLLRAEVTQREQKRVASEGAAKVLGVTGGATPLNQRGKGSNVGRKKEGGGVPD
jgi:hypothetical protein